MPAIASSLLDLRSLSQIQLQEFFSLASGLKKQKRSPQYLGQTIALMFFEPSTRTRLSFEAASYHMGLGPLNFDGSQGTSLEKGETIEDSILNVSAMKPELMVIRCNDKLDLQKISELVTCPVINAGWGILGHPTQALLDVFTMSECLGAIEGKKVLIVGDVKHSRVAASHLELAKTMGYQVAICGPEEFLVEDSNVKKFSLLSEGLQWADVVMALRVQFERHDLKSSL